MSGECSRLVNDGYRSDVASAKIEKYGGETVQVLWLFGSALIGCEGAKAVDSLSVHWDSELVSSGDVVSLPTIRRFSDGASSVLTLTNGGSERTVDLSAEDGTLPEWLLFDVAFPVLLAADDSIEIEVFWENTHTDGVFSEELQLRSERVDLSFVVVGEMEPYVQLQLEEHPEVTTRVAEEIAEQNLVGAAVAVVQGQDIVYLKGFGYADLEREIDVDPSRHRFRWASIAKTFAGVLAVQQHETGQLDLDADVSTLYAGYTAPEEYFPMSCNLNSAPCALEDAVALPDTSPPISLRMLLSHTGCVQHYSNGLSHPEPPSSLRNDPDTNTGMEWALAYWQDNPLICVPGSAYSYSTMSFNLAGVALEQSTGQTYPELVESSISDVVAADTIAPEYLWEADPDRAVGYSLDSSSNEITRIWSTDVSWKLAGGGFHSTPEDLARYCGGLLGDELVAPELKAELLWASQTSAVSSTDYGLGFKLYSDGRVGHNGSQPASRTILKMDPQSDRCFVVMSSSNWAQPSDVLDVLVDAYTASTE